jgi:flagellar assembly protein FliH
VAVPAVSSPVSVAPPPDEPVIARPSPVPHDVIALESAALRDENAALHHELGALRAENAALVLQLDASAKAQESLSAQVLRSSEPEVVALAVAVAERVIGRELTTDPAVVADWAREALDALSVRDGVVVTVSPDVAAQVPAEAWSRALAAPHALTVDASLPPVSCAVRAGASAADASLDGRMTAVRDALAEVSP